MELPPRARRIPNLIFPLSITQRNYLRVRGEYRNLVTKARLCMELPPRARRILIGCDSDDDELGTTSACAENTGIYIGTYYR